VFSQLVDTPVTRRDRDAEFVAEFLGGGWLVRGVENLGTVFVPERLQNIH